MGAANDQLAQAGELSKARLEELETEGELQHAQRCQPAKGGGNLGQEALVEAQRVELGERP